MLKSDGTKGQVMIYKSKKEECEIAELLVHKWVDPLGCYLGHKKK